MSYKRRSNKVRSPRFCVFPGYNWCGPGCSGPGVPINAVDAACQAHDECYLYHGNYCACDQAFIERLTALQTPYTPEGRHARTMLRYMKVQRFFTCL
ncbi:phospholipase [Salibacterium salarium]|uniref:Phospholipase n=1 Tax=Salibacterium salarium TaxID=284579 RepID=A0A3R9P4C1_9BACI|nr:phospholipase [Salibacterium salarium]RSL30784.1 phospholipase [Salibacterium salarium]